MKQKLFILSLCCIGFVGCSSKTNLSNEKVTVSPVAALFEIVFNWERTIVHDVDSLIQVIDAIDDNLKAYNLKNPIDPNSILFTSEKKLLLLPFREKATELMGEPVSHNDYEVWLGEINGKKILEFSFSTHPTEEWVFTIRKKR